MKMLRKIIDCDVSQENVYDRVYYSGLEVHSPHPLDETHLNVVREIF